MKNCLRRNLNSNLKLNQRSKIRNSRRRNLKLLKYSLITPELNKVTIKISEKNLILNLKNSIQNFIKWNLPLKNKRNPLKNFRNKRPFKTKNSMKSRKLTLQCPNSQKRNKNNLKH